MSKTIEIKYDLSLESGENFYEYEVLYPGGNTTALVAGLVTDPERRRIINDQIMSTNADLSNGNVEQVGFYDLSDINRPKLQMAGNELCVNAIRALAYLSCLKSGSKIRKFEIEVILENQTLVLSAGIDGFQLSWMEMPLNDIRTNFDQEIYQVSLTGITQLVVNRSLANVGDETLRSQAYFILNQQNLLNTVPAAGVTFVDKNAIGLITKFFVYVKDVETFIDESACGSGTIAAYLALADQQMACSIQQPSGYILQVETRQMSGDNQSRVLRISGPVNRIK